jgi:hypothetical protein
MQDSATSKSEVAGIKHDLDKPDLSLLPYEFLAGVAQAMMFGEKKYGRYNFMGGIAWHRIGAAGARHLFKWLGGEDLDPESGLHHLCHAGACVLMAYMYVTHNLGEDTRFKK